MVRRGVRAIGVLYTEMEVQRSTMLGQRMKRPVPRVKYLLQQSYWIEGDEVTGETSNYAVDAVYRCTHRRGTDTETVYSAWP